MDSFKEKDKLAPKPSKRPCIEAAEELMRQMIAGRGKYGRSRGKHIGNGIRSIGTDD